MPPLLIAALVVFCVLSGLLSWHAALATGERGVSTFTAAIFGWYAGDFLGWDVAGRCAGAAGFAAGCGLASLLHYRRVRRLRAIDALGDR